MVAPRAHWLAVSALLHGGVVLVGLLLRAAPTAPPLEVELIRVPPPAPAPVARPAPRPEAQGSRQEAASVQEPASSVRRHPPARVPHPASGTRRDVEETEQSAVADQPALSLSMRDPRREEPDLHPSFHVLDDTNASPPAAEARARPAARPADSTKQRLDRMLADDKAAQDFEAGRVHPHLYAVQRDAEGLLHPSWSLVEGDRAGIGKLGTATAALIREFGRDYLRKLRRLAEGAPRKEGVPQPEMLETYNRMLRVAEEHADRLACLVCVALGNGRAFTPRVTRSSGRRPFDHLAVDAVKKAVRSREVPRDLKPVQACYLVEARFHRVPPVPMVGCSFDESKPSISCFYPTKKILRSNVKLLSARPLGS